MSASTMFCSGLVMVIVGAVCFIILCDTSTRKRTVIEDVCAFVFFAGLIIAVIGALLWIGSALA